MVLTDISELLFSINVYYGQKKVSPTVFRVWLICQNHVPDIRVRVNYFLPEFGLSDLEIVLQRGGSGGELVLVLDIRIFCLSVFRLDECGCNLLSSSLLLSKLTVVYILFVVQR